ncbi:MAG: response regulator transcription factor [Rhodocyclaceae bacterium]|nr:response regulator transcription factor [Rhodocyclaceae bacterium]
MFSACDDHRSMLAAMSAGAERFVSKQESLDVLVEAALEIAARLRPAANKPPPEPARTGAKRSAAPPEASAVTMLYRLLAPQERRIIPLLERGLSNKEIARYLGLSHQTVRNYLANAARKSKVSGRGELLDLFSVCEFDFSQYPGLDSFDFSEPGRHPQSGPYTGTA